MRTSHALRMTQTTIRVPTDLGDLLKAQAGSHGRTLGEHLRALADAQARLDRWADLERAVTEHPVDEEYLDQVREWQSDPWN